MTMENTMPGYLSAAAATAEGGPTFLGEDWTGWRTALIAAVVAALAYEATLALLRVFKPRAVRFVTLRLPFLLLATARLTVPPTAWKELYGPLKADLWDVLDDGERSAIGRFAAGMAFSASLVFGGAVRTARAMDITKPETKAKGQSPRTRESSRRARRLAIGTAVTVALAGMNGPWLYRYLSQDDGSFLGTLLLMVSVGGAVVTAVTAMLSARSALKTAKLISAADRLESARRVPEDQPKK
ncbi:hypothetical protein [Streptomyces sp. SID13726]|uniref:hypothetical protein n=1 Tax=Streptomyces sp. SID13726 TaxID=2706058 RepID=UPI0013B87186|nr:hypothetical protein [Streptomyces sp. SID13726]NEB02485.1 hypothetical protein [Streptomyces sp. SID13726]